MLNVVFVALTVSVIGLSCADRTDTFNGLTILPAVNNLLSGLGNNVDEIAGQLTPVESFIKQPSATQVVNGLSPVVENEINAFQAASNSFHNMVGVINTLLSYNNGGQNSEITYDVPHTLINQLEATLTQIGNALGTVVTEFQKLLNDLNEAASQVAITPDGYIQMPQALDQQFIDIVNDVAVTSNTTSANFETLSANVRAIETAVAAADRSSIASQIFFICIEKICNQAMQTFSQVSGDVTAIDNSFNVVGTLVHNGTSGTYVLIPQTPFADAVGAAVKDVIFSFFQIGSNLGLLNKEINYMEQVLINVLI